MLKLTQQLMAYQLSLKGACEKQEVNTSRSIHTTGNSEGSSIPAGPPSLVDSRSEHLSAYLTIWMNLCIHAEEPEQQTYTSTRIQGIN